MAAANQKSSMSQQLVNQICMITGADEDTAARLLEACNGNVEMAIGMHLDGGGGGSESGEAQANVSHDEQLPAADGAAGVSSDDVRAPIPQRNEVLVDEQYRYGFRGRKKKTASVFDGFRDFQAEARQQELSIAGSSSSKRRTLEDLFRPPIELLHRGSFHSARDIGTQQNKWLMVNIQNVQEFSCQALNRDVWSNGSVKRLIRDHFIFWQVYHDGEEGQRYIQFYKVTEWPYVAVIDPITGEQMVAWNKIQQSPFIDIVSEFLVRYPSPDGSSKTASPPNKKLKSSHSIVDASEESQLEAAIQASMNSPDARPQPQPHHSASQDSDDSSNNSLYEDNLEAFSDTGDDSDVAAQQRSPTTTTASPRSKTLHSPVKKTSPRKVHRQPSSPPSTSQESKCKASSITPHHSQDNGVTTDTSKQHSHTTSTHSHHTSTTNDKTDAKCKWTDFLGSDQDPKSEIMIRLPDGRRKPWSVSSSSKLKILALYVEAEGFPSDTYELLLNYPRRQLEQLDQEQTLKEAGLFPRETVFVQNI